MYAVEVNSNLFFTSSLNVFIGHSAVGRVFIRLLLLFAFNRQVYRQVVDSSAVGRVFVQLSLSFSLIAKLIGK